MSLATHSHSTLTLGRRIGVNFGAPTRAHVVEALQIACEFETEATESHG